METGREIAMEKKEFIEWFNKEFDISANFHAGSNNRTFTEQEKKNFAEKVFVLLEEHTKKVDVTKLTFALINTQRKFSNCQEQAEHIASIL